MQAARRLRRRLGQPELMVAMAAHNPLTACLVEEAGFDAIWASGFELSATFGVPDASVVSVDEHLNVTRRMCERVELPVIADLDSGYGDATNVHYVMRRYVAAGVAGVVIEDQRFPKDSSLRQAGHQQLVLTPTFAGKIRAAIDARENSGVLVIARTEALIVGAGLDEALERAAAYGAAGADMILVHSKASTPDEVLSFAKQWEPDIPLAVVPTAFPDLSESLAEATGKIKLFIYANHAVRATVMAVRDTFRRIRSDRSAAGVAGAIASVEDIMALQGDAHRRRIDGRFRR